MISSPTTFSIVLLAPTVVAFYNPTCLPTTTLVKVSTPNVGTVTRRRRQELFQFEAKSKQQYLRIQRTKSRGNRDTFELQTAVATLRKDLGNGQVDVIDLHSQLHYGNEDYFAFYNDASFNERYQKVFYELIASNDFLQTTDGNTKRLLPSSDERFPNPIMPTPSDEATARAYGLACQLNVINYTQKNWVHCDTTREEFEAMVNGQNDDGDGSTQQAQVPPWTLASTTTSPIQEYTSALLRPRTPSTALPSNYISSQRLFSNLFLPGSTLVAVFRLLLWIFSPSPEVSILLLDWSSLIDPKPTGGISPVFSPVIRSVLNGNWIEAKRLVFAQLLVSGQTAGGKDLILVKGRNKVAIDILSRSVMENRIFDSNAIATNNSIEPTKSRNAILYGTMHCQDLQSQLESFGYRLSEVDWRTCWKVSVPSLGSGGVFESISRSGGRRGLDDLGLGLLVVPLYLLIGGLDWLVTVEGVAESIDSASYLDCTYLAIFYLVRHIALYLGLAKFVIQWDGEINLFGTSSR